MDKVPEKLVHISKRDIKKLFRLATEFCQWDEYEKGDKYRDNKTSLGLKEFLEQNLNTKVQSRNKLKVKALDYTSNDAFPRDPANKQSLITYMTNKWIDKVEAQPIINTTKLNRANKIDSLLKKP